MLGVLLGVLPWVVLGDPGDWANLFLSLMKRKKQEGPHNGLFSHIFPDLQGPKTQTTLMPPRPALDLVRQ